MKNRGFTLVEFIVAMTAGVAIVMVAMFLYTPVRNWVFIQDQRSGMAADTAAVMKIAREIGRIKDPSLITTMTANALTFTDVDDAVVCFSLSGGNLLRGGDILVSGVAGLTFTYLDASGAVTAIAADVRTIRIEIVLTSGSQTIRLETAARVRNFT